MHTVRPGVTYRLMAGIMPGDSLFRVTSALASCLWEVRCRREPDQPPVCRYYFLVHSAGAAGAH